MECLLALFILSNIIIFSKGIIPLWNLENSAINLLSSSTEYTYIVVDRELYGMKVKLTKTIKKTETGISHENFLSVNGGTPFKVDFENIESFYNINSKYIICPKGKNKLYSATDKAYFEPTGFYNSGNWDLKCYKHNTKYFVVMYLMNGDKPYYYSPFEDTSGDFNWRNKYVASQLYDFKLKDGTSYKDSSDQWLKYPMGSLILEDSKLKLKSIGVEFHDHSQKDELSYVTSTTANPQSIDIIEVKEYTQAYFKNYSDEFYFMTYNDVSDFKSGYSSVTTDDYLSLSNVQVIINEDSPFEFMDEVEIIEMNFLLYNKYIYYAINNTQTQKTYHGIYDVILNKIMFNTDINIDTFIPYSNNSMLAITGDNAYRICAIQINGECVDQCTTGTLIRDSDGNKCSDSCDGEKYLLIPDNICITECDTSIYILNNDNKKCGLCKDMDSTKPYKIIGSSQCLSEILNETVVYNEKFKLLKCKSGYILNDNNCIPHCYPTCKTCSDYSENENDQQCLSCNEGFYFENKKCIEIIHTTIPIIASTTNPIISTTIPIKMPTTIPKAIPTTIITTIPETVPKIECLDEKCLTCSEASNKLGLCLTCNEAKGYKKVNYTYVFTEYLNCIKQDNPKYRKYYYNETLKEYRPCYKTCKTCLKAGNAEAQNCLECESGYMLRPDNNPHNNCVVYSEFYYISSYNQYKSLNIYQCPEEAKYYVKEKKSCIDDCKKDSLFRYLYNGNCLKECPSGTNNVNNICIADSNKCILGKNELYLAENDNLEIIGTLVKSYISEFYYTNHYVSLYQNKNYSIMIYKDSSCIKELALEMPNVDFQSCYIKVKGEYGITEDLIIVIVDKNENNAHNTYYSFYHPKSGNKLNAEKICKDETIIVTESLNSVLNKNYSFYQTQTSLTSQGINIFDINDPFYTDICYDFDNPLKKDIPLNNRIKSIFPNATLCDEGCQYKGINLTDMTTTCDCKFNDIANNNAIKDNELLDNTVGEIFDLINSSNILVFKCIKNIFKHFTRSYGCWISLVLIVSHLGLSMAFFLFSSSQVNNYILSLTYNYISYITNLVKKKPNLPPKKTIANNKKGNKNINSKKPIENINNNINRIHQTPAPKTSAEELIISFNKKKKKITYDNNINIETKENLKESKKNLYIDEEKYDKHFFKEYMSTSLEDLEFDDAVAKDHRKYCEHMRENLKEDQIIANTFIAEDPIKPRSIKVILFILNVMLYFVINGLFFSEEVISELYYIDKEKENFFSFLPRSIERLVYATLVSIVIGIITDFFFIEEKKIKGIFRREKENINSLKKNISELKRDLKRRYIAFISVVSIILVISTIYLMCFNYVYPYSQMEWIKSSVAIVIIMQILSTLKCILETSLRFLSYKLKNEKLYKISKFLD